MISVHELANYIVFAAVKQNMLHIYLILNALKVQCVTSFIVFYCHENIDCLKVGHRNSDRLLGFIA